MRLKSDNIGAAVVDLADAIASNTSIKTLNLEGHISMLSFSFVTIFKYAGQGIAAEGATMLATAIAPSKILKKLSLFSKRYHLSYIIIFCHTLFCSS